MQATEGRKAMGKKTSELEKEGGQTLAHGVQQEEMLHRRHQMQLAQLANTRTSHLTAPQTAFPLVLTNVEEPNATKTTKCRLTCNTTCSVRAEQSSWTSCPPEAHRGPCYFTISNSIHTERANHTPEAAGPTSFWQSGI